MLCLRNRIGSTEESIPPLGTEERTAISGLLQGRVTLALKVAVERRQAQLVRTMRSEVGLRYRALHMNTF